MQYLLLACLLAACGGGHGMPMVDAAPDAVPIDAPIAPLLRNPVTLADDQLALQALGIIGANVAGSSDECNACHGLTRQQLHYWRALSDQALTGCLTDLAVSSPESAQQMIACMRITPSVPTSVFQTTKLGIYAAASGLPWFEFLFWRAYGDAGPAQLATFQMQAGMPRDTVPPLTQDKFDIVAEYFARGLPQLEGILMEDPPPTTCTPGISADVSAHVSAMKTTGWRQVNADNHMDMWDCAGRTDPRECLSDVPLAAAQPYGAQWDLPGHGAWRVLSQLGYATSYWTRSSASGRFVAHGAADITGSYVIDLQRGATVLVDAGYDPAFFPDDTGFVFQGGTRNLCPMSVLTSNPSHVTMTEPGCAEFSTVGLYEHLGRMLGGGDLFAVYGVFVSDDGGHGPTLDNPAAAFGMRSFADFTPLVFNGTSYTERPPVQIGTPFEGDPVMSPSTKLILSRVAGPNDVQLGYVLRRVDATRTGSTYTIDAPEIARYCQTGGKPAFSFDERWIAYHHYITAGDAIGLGFTGADDPRFAQYLTLGGSNIYLLDLTTGVPQRITNVQPGQYALYPHWRSDNWMYALVRDSNTSTEYVVASDAALIAEQP